MLTRHLIDATGLVALALTLVAMAGASDRALLRIGAWASGLWAVNSLLVGAPTAAALSALGMGRQASAAALQDRPGRLKVAAFAAFVVTTLAISGLTWTCPHSLFPATGSLIATYAMFYMRGARLRWAMVLVSSLWLANAVVYAAWWQIAANGLSGGAAAIGALRANRS